jgi:hypothetical protein
MQMTIGEAADKIVAMRTIVRAIESGGSVDARANDIAEYLDEYIIILSNTKVNV